MKDRVDANQAPTIYNDVADVNLDNDKLVHICLEDATSVRRLVLLHHLDLDQESGDVIELSAAVI